MQKVIIIEGGISVGKSTLIESLKKDSKILEKVHFLDEPVDGFSTYHTRNGEIFNPLKEQYKNEKNFPLVQIHISKTLREQYEGIDKSKEYVICERGLYSPLVFVDTQFRMGNISEFTREYLHDDIHYNAENTLKNNFEYQGVFLIDASVETCLERINSRSREGENYISKAFLSCLSDSYQAHFRMWKLMLPKNHIRLCTELDKERIVEEFKLFLGNFLIA